MGNLLEGSDVVLVGDSGQRHTAVGTAHRLTVGRRSAYGRGLEERREKNQGVEVHAERRGVVVNSAAVIAVAGVVIGALVPKQELR